MTSQMHAAAAGGDLDATDSGADIAQTAAIAAGGLAASTTPCDGVADAAVPKAVPAAPPAAIAPAADVWAAATGVGDTTAAEVLALTKRRTELRQERNRVNKELKNAERKRQRILERARGLSDDDLVAILATRAATKAAQKGKAKGKGNGKAKAKVDAE
jgi:hypothetical protein